jgi:hypothetical protein
MMELAEILVMLMNQKKLTSVMGNKPAVFQRKVYATIMAVAMQARLKAIVLLIVRKEKDGYLLYFC